jgi:hypothetical protein
MIVPVPWNKDVLHVYAEPDGTLSIILASLREFAGLDDHNVHWLLAREHTRPVVFQDMVLYLLDPNDVNAIDGRFMAEARLQYRQLLEDVKRTCDERLGKIK